MRHSLVILSSVLLAAGAAHAQPAPEPPVAEPAPDAVTAAPSDAVTASPEAQPAEAAAPSSTDATPSEASAAPDAAATAEVGAADSGEMSAEELAALGLTTEGPTVDTDVHLSGFIDFTYMAGLNSTSESVSPSDRAFAIGNINVYLTKNLTDAFRTMVEVRFTYLPNG